MGFFYVIPVRLDGGIHSLRNKRVGARLRGHDKVGHPREGGVLQFNSWVPVCAGRPATGGESKIPAQPRDDGAQCVNTNAVCALQGTLLAPQEGPSNLP